MEPGVGDGAEGSLHEERLPRGDGAPSVPGKWLRKACASFRICMNVRMSKVPCVVRYCGARKRYTV